MLSRAALQKLDDRFPALQPLPVAVRERITQEASHARVRSGGVLFDFDAPCAAFPLLLAGRMRLVQTADNGRELTAAREKWSAACCVALRSKGLSRWAANALSF